MPEAVNARSGQCPKRSMPEAVPIVRGKRALPWKERSYRFLKHLHPDNIANLFRVLNTAEGGGADSVPAAFKLAFRYWCMNEELPLHFNSYKPLECLRLQKFALDFNRSQAQVWFSSFQMAAIDHNDFFGTCRYGGCKEKSWSEDGFCWMCWRVYNIALADARARWYLCANSDCNKRVKFLGEVCKKCRINVLTLSLDPY